MNKWDVEAALAKIFDETEEVNRFRKDIAAKRAEGQVRMTFVMLGSLVLGFLISMLTRNGAGFWVALPSAVVGGLWFTMPILATD